jgi:transposase-like protein
VASRATIHKDKRAKAITGTGGKGNAIVFGLLERGGKVRTEVVEDRQSKTVQPLIRQHIAAGAALYTDSMLGYSGLDSEFAHRVVDHAVEYVNGCVRSGLERRELTAANQGGRLILLMTCLPQGGRFVC